MKDLARPEDDFGLDDFIAKLEVKFGPVATLAMIVGGITVIAMFFAFPDEMYIAVFGKLRFPQPGGRFVQCYIPLCRDPWHTNFSDPVWQAFRHRLLAPVIAWCLGLRGRSGGLVPVFANPFVYLISYIVLRIRTAAGTAFLASLVLSLTLACVTSQVWPGYQDSLATLFLLLSMAVISPAASAGCMLIGLLADERILAAVPLVLLWHGWVNGPSEKGAPRALIRALWFVVALAVWGFYMALQKHFYGTDFHQIMQAAHADFLGYKRNVWPGWYYGLRGGWLLPLGLVMCWILSANYLKASALVLAIVPILAISFEVGDISRVASMAFPAILIGTVLLYRARPVFANHLLIAAVLIQFCSPIYTIIGTVIRPIEPMPLAIIDDLFGQQLHRPVGSEQSEPGSKPGENGPGTVELFSGRAGG